MTRHYGPWHTVTLGDPEDGPDIDHPAECVRPVELDGDGIEYQHSCHLELQVFSEEGPEIPDDLEAMEPGVYRARAWSERSSRYSSWFGHYEDTETGVDVEPLG